MTPDESSLGPDSLEALKRLKQAELDAAEKVAAAKRAADSAIERAKNETEAIVHEAREEAERSREVALGRARDEIAAEAERIESEGHRAAGEVDMVVSGTKGIASKVIEAVVSDFRSD